MRTILIPPARPRRASTAPPPPIPARPPALLRCIEIPSRNPLAALSDDAIGDLIDHIDEDDVAVIVDAPPAR